jgi:DNA repair exonuclease SbcCD ATPase subunit
MGIWNEIQEQLKELQQLLDERKQLDEIYNQIKTENDRITDFS